MIRVPVGVAGSTNVAAVAAKTDLCLAKIPICIESDIKKNSNLALLLVKLAPCFAFWAAPGKLYQSKLEFSRNLSGRTEYEEEPVHGRTDHRDIEAA
jgi:hypothetical protein